MTDRPHLNALVTVGDLLYPTLIWGKFIIDIPRPPFDDDSRPYHAYLPATSSGNMVAPLCLPSSAVYPQHIYRMQWNNASITKRCHICVMEATNLVLSTDVYSDEPEPDPDPDGETT